MSRFRRSITLVAFTVGLCASEEYAHANTLYFPQVAVGGGYSTTFVLMNTSTASASTAVVFFNEDGSINSAYQQFFTIPVGGSVRFTASSAGPLTVLWARVRTGTGTVQGVATFDLRSPNGQLLTTAGVLGIDAANSFVLPVDVTSNASTGVAIANVATNAVNVRLRLIAEDGSAVGTASDARLTPLGSNAHVANFVTSFFPNPAGTTFRGTLVIENASGSTDAALAATALTVKEGMLSALPTISAAAPSGGTTGGMPGSASVVISVDSLGGSTIQFQNRTIASPSGTYTFSNLAPGTYEMTGTVGSYLGILFSNGFGILGSGGVVPGSLQSLAGPTPVLDQCSVIYINTGTSSQSYRLRFTVTSTTSAACGGQ